MANELWASELHGTQGSYALDPAGGEIFVRRVPGVVEAPIVHFLDPDANGRFRTLHSGLRINHRR